MQRVWTSPCRLSRTSSHGLGRATGTLRLHSYTSREAAYWDAAARGRTHVYSEYIVTRFTLHIALNAFGSTRLVCFQPHFCLHFSFSPAAAPAPAALAASSPRIFEAAMNLDVETTCQPSAHNMYPLETRRRCHAVAFSHPHPHATSTPSIPHRHEQPKGKRPTYPPPHHPPKPRTYSACTAVMPTRFSISARCAFNWASCACRWVYCLLRLIVEAEADVDVDVEMEAEAEEWERVDVEGGWDEADILEGYRVVGNPGCKVMFGRKYCLKTWWDSASRLVWIAV